MTAIYTIRESIENHKSRSCWDRAVTAYALELLEEYEDNYGRNACAPCEVDLLNGADNWSEYSWGGSSLIYNADIAERTCTPSELKKTKFGDRRPNSREEWLDVQARALWQAARLIKEASRK